MAEHMNTGKTPAKKRRLIWVAAIAGFLLLTWCTMFYNDYNRVMRQYVKPAFCINFDPAYQEYRSIVWWDAAHPEELARKEEQRYIINYGFFQGVGYNVELSGAFVPFDRRGDWPPRDKKTGDILQPWPGILQARFTLFGKEIGRVNRPYPEDAGRTEDWQLREIF